MSEFDTLPEGYIQLAIAVCQQAAEDYKTEYKRYLKHGVKTKRFRELEHWFQYGWGKHYSFGKGALILKMLREEVDAQRKRGRGSDRPIEYNGVTKSLYEWADEYGISRKTLSVRLSKGWTIEEALTTPLGGRREQSTKDI